MSGELHDVSITHRKVLGIIGWGDYIKKVKYKDSESPIENQINQMYIVHK